MIIYIITSGDYSDYGICSVATTLDDAYRKLTIAAGKYWGSAYIETWDTEEGRVCGNRRNRYDVYWDGEKLVCNESKQTYSTMSATQFMDMVRFRSCINFKFRLEGIHAKSEEHAIKIASDMLAEYKAHLEGIT